MALNNRFRRGSATYTCGICGKLTRDTGRGEGSLDYCRDCYEDAGDENEHYDTHGEPVEGCKWCEKEGK